MDEIAAGPQGRIRAIAAVSGFVLAWMVLGWLLKLDPNAYLLLGVPLTILFQSLLRRRPLKSLWVRESPRFQLGKAGVALAIAFSLIPLLSLAGAVEERDLVGVLFSLCSVVGAFGAAYALRMLRREQLLPLALCLLITTLLDAVQWSLFLGVGLIETTPPEGGMPERVIIGLISFFQYIAVVFVMEEVAFRMLDSHLQEPSPRWDVWSALGLSVAWAVWHVPIDDELTWVSIGLLLYVHVPYGLCLSYFWRKTGNLMVPGLSHAFGDAIRNAILASA